MGIFLRWLGAFALVAATFNPTDWNYVRWALAHYDDQLPLVVLAGLVLIAGYIVYLGATINSIGFLGVALLSALAGALIWVLIDWGVLALDNTDVNLWVGLIAVSMVLGIGLSWGHIRRRLAGQQTVADPEE